jgi:hypothetical protein
MLGRRPYNGVNRNEIRDQVLSKQFQLKPEEIPQGWNKEAADFVNRVILTSHSSSNARKRRDWVRRRGWKNSKRISGSNSSLGAT